MKLKLTFLKTIQGNYLFIVFNMTLTYLINGNIQEKYKEPMNRNNN